MRYSLNYKYNYEVITFIKINDKAYILEKNEVETTLIQFLDRNHIKIPRFCYHEALSIAGNCRMCLVEIVGGVKLVISCATQILEGLEVLTNSILVKKARESILEFLLINHPLDCPICDQGGECDLQDQTSLFGSDRSRFSEIKRSVFDKNFGPFIKTIMTRCIHCTRCVRFMEDIAKEPVLGLFGRGKNSEISLYNNIKIETNISGNLIDICPVGALTSKPYAFKVRPWELNITFTIDILDSLNSTIIVNTKQNKIMRILPKINPEINGFWITDYIRFIYDSVYNNRLLVPALKIDNSFFKPIEWTSVLNIVLKILNETKKITFIVNNLESITSNYYLHLIANSLNSIIFLENNSNNNIQNELKLHMDINSKDIYILNNINIKENLNLLWIKLMEIKNNILQIGSLNYNTISHIGLSNITLLLLLLGKNLFSNKLLQNKVNVYTNDTFMYINNISFYNLMLNSGEISYNYVSTIKNDLVEGNICYLMNTLNCLLKYKQFKFIIYHGVHYTLDASRANIILPASSFLEDSELYLNIYGFFQKTEKVIYSVIEIKSKIYILLQILTKLNIKVDFISKFISSLNYKMNYIGYNNITKQISVVNNIYYNGFKELSNSYNLASKNIMSWFKYKQRNDFYRNI